MMKKISGGMNPMFIVTTILVLIFALTACGGVSPTQPQQGAPQAEQPGAAPEATEAVNPPAEETQPTQAPQGSEDPQRLMIPRWFMTALTLDGQPVEVAPGQQSVTLQFEMGGKANGTGGCNNFSTSYQADYDGSMTFGPVISTKMACEGSMALENAYFQALSQVERFSTEDGLVLSSVDGKTKIEFHMPPK